jgi:glycosyltransferase involved in cell wall biosynthesis
LKIALIDTNQKKFTGDMIAHWQACGHQVQYFNTCRRPHMEWADVLWFDCVDMNLIAATKKDPSLVEGKKVIARAIDIDVWANHFNAVDFDRVDHLIFIAPHVMDYLLSKKKVSCPVHLIPCGVDTDRFTMRKDPVKNKDVAVVARLWHGKGIDLLLQAIAMMPEFTFHICGKWGLNGIERGWYKNYIDQFLSHHDNWTYTEQVPDMNDWLEDKTYAVCFSKKEAFSYSTAEAASKGLMPFVHEFYGCQDVWPILFRWHSLDELATAMRCRWYDPESYRAYVVDRYPLGKMLEAFDALL